MGKKKVTDLKNNEGISVIIPAYQEAENLKIILPKLQNILNSIAHEVLVIDTLETMDNTDSICSDNECMYIHRENGNFYGDAIRTGIKYSRYTRVVIMDADGSHNPEEILTFYSKSKQYDMVIGSRYCKGGYTDNPLMLQLMSYILNMTYRLFFGIKVKDVSNSFRMYYGPHLKELDLVCDNFDIVEEILIRLTRLHPKYQIYETPILFNKRIYGESKRDLWKFIISYIKTMHFLLEIKNEKKENK